MKIFIGVKKGGTGAAIKMLNLHTQLVVPNDEIHYFDWNYDRGLPWYISKMPMVQQGQVP